MTLRVERIVTNIILMFKFVANRAGAVTEAKVVTAVEASIEAAVGTAPAANLRTVRIDHVYFCSIAYDEI